LKNNNKNLLQTTKESKIKKLKNKGWTVTTLQGVQRKANPDCWNERMQIPTIPNIKYFLNIGDNI
jgi:hypothetical protein